jgi:predicted lipid-binding transport protein (Tim44 family)
MRTLRASTIALVGVTLASGPALAQPVYVYPARGQDPQQQSFDESQCSNWAIQQTGFNPMNPQPAMAPPPAPPSGVFGGGALRGAAGGAALGAVGGAIGGNAGEGAAIGAATGALFGVMRRREEWRNQEQQQQSYQQQQQAMAAQGRANWNRAYEACLTGRGYTVN